MKSIYNNKRVLVTGHTGFKGSWLVHLLKNFGATVYGYSLPPLPHQLLFSESQVEALCEESIYANINDLDQLKRFVENVQPDYVFHLAAQALVITSYKDPVETFMTNVMGTVHVLESLKTIQKPCTAIMITTDKVYQNDEDGRLYEENDKLGGKDPYSASKACDEIVIHSYQNSYFNKNSKYSHIKVASVRAGNVIGGGDYSENRIIPDLVRAIKNNASAEIRHPHAIRPWQHVIEPLYAYCLLASQLINNESLIGAYNIGPYESDMLEVQEIIDIFHEKFGEGQYTIAESDNNLKEAQTLKLNNNKIKEKIGFTPRLNAAQAIEWTALWYKNTTDDFKTKCQKDIEKYLNL